MLVGRPGRKECAGCEQVGVAELCMWVLRCGENLHVFSGFAQMRATRPTPPEDPGFHPRSWTVGFTQNQAPETQGPRSFCLLWVLPIEANCATSP